MLDENLGNELKEPIEEQEQELVIIDVNNITDLVKYKEWEDVSNVRFKINKQLIIEQSYEQITSKRKLKGILQNSHLDILFALRRFYENLQNYASISEDSAVVTFDELKDLREEDIIQLKPFEQVVDEGDLVLIDAFRAYVADLQESLKLESNEYDE